MSNAQDIAQKLAEIGVAAIGCIGAPSAGVAATAAPFLPPLVALCSLGSKMRSDRRRGCVDAAAADALKALNGVTEFEGLNLLRTRDLLADNDARARIGLPQLIAAAQQGHQAFLPTLRDALMAAIAFQPDDHLERRAVELALTAALTCLTRNAALMNDLLPAMAMTLLKGQAKISDTLTAGFDEVSRNVAGVRGDTQAILKGMDRLTFLWAGMAEAPARPTLTISQTNTVVLGWSGDPPGWAAMVADALRAALDRSTGTAGALLTLLPCNLADLAHDLDSALWRPLADVAPGLHAATVVHLRDSKGAAVPMGAGLRAKLSAQGHLAQRPGEPGLFDATEISEAEATRLTEAGAFAMTAPLRLVAETLRRDQPLLVWIDAHPDDRSARFNRLIGWLKGCGVTIHEPGTSGASSGWADALTRRILGLAADGVANPFRKLDHYLMADAAHFHGRSDEGGVARAWLAAALRGEGPAVLRLEGPSGVGKSSFLHAGIGPAAEAEGCLWLDFRPDDVPHDPRKVFSPLAVLCTRIDDRLGGTTGLAQRGAIRLPDAAVAVSAATAWAAEWAEHMRQRGQRLLIGIDQFEDILDHLDQPQSGPWRALADFLDRLARRRDTLLVVTVESSRLPLLGVHLAGSAIAQAQPLPLDGGRAFLRRAIMLPFADAGITLAEDIVTPLLDDTLALQGGDGSALPLLVIKLHGLFQQVAGRLADPAAACHVTLADLAGEPLSIEEEIVNLARQAWHDAGAGDDDDMDTFLRPYVRLIADDDRPEGYRIALRVVPARQFRTAAQLEAAFVRRRLIVPTPGGARLVHEAVLRRWPMAADWLTREAPALLRDTARAQRAAAWDMVGRPPLSDPGPEAIAEAARALSDSSTEWALGDDDQIGAEAVVERAHALALFDHARDPATPVAGSKSGNLFIHLAALYGRVDLIRRFAAADPATPVLPRQDGRQPLGQAAWTSAEAVRCLLDLGADPNATQDKGVRPLDLAIWGGCRPTFDLILPLTDPAQASAAVANPLSSAAQTGEFDLLRRLEQRGFAHDGPAINGFTPLIGAAWGGDPAIFVHCLDRGDPCLRDSQGLNTLDVLAVRGNYRLIRRLIEDPRSIGCLTPDPATGMTALHHAAGNLWPKTVRDLLGLGLDPNAVIAAGVEKGQTPLHRALAVVAGQPPESVPRHLLDRCSETVAALLASDRLNVNPPDGRDRTPLSMAAPQPALLALLMDHASFQPERAPPGILLPLDEAIAAGDRGRITGLLVRPAYCALLMHEGPDQQRRVMRLLDLGMDGLLRSLIATGQLNPWQAWPGEISLPERAAHRDDPALLNAILARLDQPPSTEQGLALIAIRCGLGPHYTAPRLDADGRLTGIWLASRPDEQTLAEALEMALTTGQTAIVVALLQAGVDAQRIDNWGRRPHQRAADWLAETPALRLPTDLADPNDEAWTRIEAGAMITDLPPMGPDAVIHARPLPWHPHGQLLMILDPDAAAGLPLYVLRGERGSDLLDRSSAPIHSFNRREGVVIDSPSAALAYLRFFCFFLTASDRPFMVFESLGSRLWPPSMRDGNRDLWARIGERFQAPRHCGRDPQGQWRISAVVGHQRRLFRTDFLIAEDGSVEIVADQLLMDPLPVSLDLPIRTS